MAPTLTVFLNCREGDTDLGSPMATIETALLGFQHLAGRIQQFLTQDNLENRKCRMLQKVNACDS